MSSLRKRVGRWGVIWAIGGLIAGSILAVTDSGHVPAFLAPLIMALAGGLAGLLAGLLFRGLAWGPLAVRSSGGLLLLGVVAGAVAGAALSVAGIGISRAYCMAAGALLGAVSATRAEG